MVRKIRRKQKQSREPERQILGGIGVAVKAYWAGLDWEAERGQIFYLATGEANSLRCDVCKLGFTIGGEIVTVSDITGLLPDLSYHAACVPQEYAQ